MIRPPRKTKQDLQHPKDQRSKFNGAKRRKEGSFNTRVSSVEGTRAPSNVKEVEIARLTPEGTTEGRRDITGAVQSVPVDYIYRSSFVKNHATSPSPSFDPSALKSHQEKMLTKKRKR